jgi:hypothetical protein
MRTWTGMTSSPGSWCSSCCAGWVTWWRPSTTPSAASSACAARQDRLLSSFLCIILIRKHKYVENLFFMFGGTLPLFLFIFTLIKRTYYSESTTLIIFIASARWRASSGVPSRDSNSGLPTRYDLSHAAPLIIEIYASKTLPAYGCRGNPVRTVLPDPTPLP